ncbi:hypothetical protein OF83DRAFT_345750 [Amylostereum chailletii]|nr:hypothetical protein OF83DRAFT_345750 [Amylostereum chailletii]
MHHDEDMKGLWVGPQPPAEFLDEHLVPAPASISRPEWKPSSKGAKKIHELDLVSVLAPFCPSLALEDTHDTPGQAECAKVFRKADMNVFDKNDNPLKPVASDRAGNDDTSQTASSTAIPSTSTPGDPSPIISAGDVTSRLSSSPIAGMSQPNSTGQDGPQPTPSTTSEPSASTTAPPPSSPDPGSPDSDRRRLMDIFSKMQMFLELKNKTEDRHQDIFNAPRQEPNPKTKDPRRAGDKSVTPRGQVTSYAMTMFENSSRVFVFSVLIIQEEARFMRWDRSGVIFSERFNWLETDYLAEFFWRFNHMTPVQRGFDPTVTTPSEKEEQIARKAFQAVKDKTYKALLPTQNDPLRRFQVWDGADFHTVITGRAHVFPRTFPGRSTFGYVGVDLTDLASPTVVFLKDSWRLSVDGMVPEGKIYERLKEKNVTNLPDYRYGGDVPLDPTPPPPPPSPPPQEEGCSSTALPSPPTLPQPREVQKTLTQEYTKRKWAFWTGDIYEHTHHRIVLGKIGRPLNTFTSTKELCQVLFDALLCHWKAFKLARILHRDISAGNILIDEDGHGILIDWDLCRELEAGIIDARRRWQTGTPQFMSVEIFMVPFGRDHLLRDDLESFVHLLFHHVLKYRPTACGQNLYFPRVFTEVFDAFNLGPNGEATGGIERMSMLTGSIFPDKELQESSLPSALVDIMIESRSLFAPLYATAPPPKKAVGQALPSLQLFLDDVDEPVDININALAKAKAAQARAEQVEAQRRKAHQKLEKSIPLAQIFSQQLANAAGWAGDGPAMNQLPQAYNDPAYTGKRSTLGGHGTPTPCKKRRSDLIAGVEPDYGDPQTTKRIRRNDGSKSTPTSLKPLRKRKEPVVAEV